MIVQPFPKTSERLKGKGIRHKNGPFKKISVCLTDINEIRSPLGSLRSLFPTISAGGQGFSRRVCLEKNHRSGFCLKEWTPLKSLEDPQSSWENLFSRNTASCCWMESLFTSIRSSWFSVVQLPCFLTDLLPSCFYPLLKVQQWNLQLLFQNCLFLSSLLNVCFLWFGVLLLGS